MFTLSSRYYIPFKAGHILTNYEILFIVHDGRTWKTLSSLDAANGAAKSFSVLSYVVNVQGLVDTLDRGVDRLLRELQIMFAYVKYPIILGACFVFVASLWSRLCELCTGLYIFLSYVGLWDCFSLFWLKFKISFVDFD